MTDMSLLHRDPSAVEADLRGQVGRLHAQRRELLCLIEQQRVELARTERRLHDANRRIDHLEHDSQKRRSRWWTR